MTGIHRGEPRTLRQRNRDKWLAKHEPTLTTLIAMGIGALIVIFILWSVF